MGLQQTYFNLIYNPIYDFTTGRLSLYRKLQNLAVGRLELHDREEVLCVGVGTGNEINQILQMKDNVKVTGIDYSRTALKKAELKVQKQGKEVSLFFMDAHKLEFASGSFDKIFCFHVLDFVPDGWVVVNETLRVVKPGGGFVITFPSDTEGLSMGYELVKDIIHYHSQPGKNRFFAVFAIGIHVLSSLVYVPLFLRKHKKVYSCSEIQKELERQGCSNIVVEENEIYRDFIVSGVKQN